MVDVSDFFESAGKQLVFHPVACVTLGQAVDIIIEAITLTRENEIFKLLVDTTDLTGFKSPTLYERFFFVQQWAWAAKGVRISFVARPEMIDPQKFGVTVAYNRGLIGDVFTSKEEALAWLEKIK